MSFLLRDPGVAGGFLWFVLHSQHGRTCHPRKQGQRDKFCSLSALFLLCFVSLDSCFRTSVLLFSHQALGLRFFHSQVLAGSKNTLHICSVCTWLGLCIPNSGAQRSPFPAVLLVVAPGRSLVARLWLSQLFPCPEPSISPLCSFVLRSFVAAAAACSEPCARSLGVPFVMLLRGAALRAESSLEKTSEIPERNQRQHGPR